MAPVLNVSAYRFVALADPLRWQRAVAEEARVQALRGTVLLAEEGINLMLAGEPAKLQAFLDWLLADPAFSGMPLKTSRSQALPFDKLVVKVKREIVRMNHPMIRPHQGRAPAVDAETLARWLDTGVDADGRPVVMLDTRNGFEVDAGRFDGAIDWRLPKFSDFPQALRAHRAELEGKTVVSYCTGGIRCEKAALLMRSEGIAHVHQLDGGILRYFERAGARHFSGRCFVFDQRGALDDMLRPSPAV